MAKFRYFRGDRSESVVVKVEIDEEFEGEEAR